VNTIDIQRAQKNLTGKKIALAFLPGVIETCGFFLSIHVFLPKAQPVLQGCSSARPGNRADTLMLFSVVLTNFTADAVSPDHS